MSEEKKSVPTQVVQIYGQSNQIAYERTVSMREVTFTCVVCHKSVTQLRYPGRLPLYCDHCRAVREEERYLERVRRQREKRQRERINRG